MITQEATENKRAQQPADRIFETGLSPRCKYAYPATDRSKQIDMPTKPYPECSPAIVTRSGDFGLQVADLKGAVALQGLLKSGSPGLGRFDLAGRCSVSSQRLAPGHDRAAH